MALRAALSVSTKRRICGVAAIALALLGTAGPGIGQSISSTPRPVRANPGADLWSAQEQLVGKSVEQLPARVPDRPNIYAVAIAPLGTQTLFSREAKTALQAFATNYGGTATGGILLSNFTADLMKVPLATQGNIEQVLVEIGKRTEAAPDDVLLVYLTSHGGRDAALQSALPGNLPILAISAESMAAALEQAHVRRRVIIISACFAGSWIPHLANDDTIIITAAAADRTSFGCADDRPLTYFGEAFLTGPFSRGASLADSFEATKKTVTQWEQEQKLLFSLPQAYIGKNMQAFWQTAPGQIGKPAPVKLAKQR